MMVGFEKTSTEAKSDNYNNKNKSKYRQRAIRVHSSQKTSHSDKVVLVKQFTL
jgi:hypothetical protein